MMLLLESPRFRGSSSCSSKAKFLGVPGRGSFDFGLGIAVAGLLEVSRLICSGGVPDGDGESSGFGRRPSNVCLLLRSLVVRNERRLSSPGRKENDIWRGTGSSAGLASERECFLGPKNLSNVVCPAAISAFGISGRGLS